MMSHSKTLKEKLLPHQRNTANWIFKHRKAIIIDNQATGKSFSVLAALKVLKAFPVLIVCNKHKCLQWLYEIQRINKSIKDIIVVCDYCDLNNAYCKDFKVVVFDDIDCVDVNLIKNITDFFIDYDVILGIATNFKKYKRIELWELFKLVGVSQFFASSRERFGLTFCGPQQKHEGWEYLGKSNNEDFSKLLNNCIMLCNNEAINNFHIINNANTFITVWGDKENLLILDTDIINIDTKAKATGINQDMSFNDIKVKTLENNIFFVDGEGISSNFPVAFDNVLFSSGHSLPNWNLKNVGQYFYTESSQTPIKEECWLQCSQLDDIQEILETLDNDKTLNDYSWTAITQCLANLSDIDDFEISKEFKKALPCYVNIS